MHTNTVWHTAENPDTVEPIMVALEDKLLYAMIDGIAAEHGTKPKFTQVGDFTMVEYGAADQRCLFFCDTEVWEKLQ